MKTRKITGKICIILTILFTVYISVIMIQRISKVVLKQSYMLGFGFELAACMFALLAVSDLRFGFFTKMKNRILKAAGWLLRIIVVLITAVLIFLFVKTTAGSFIRGSTQADHAIVLGLALENGKPADDLLRRLNTAEKYLQDHPEGTLILTGGNADASGKPEADVMHEILISRGVEEDRLLTEDRAANTMENFRNTADIIDPKEPVVLITSNYHMDRAVKTAQRAGFANIQRMPAPSSPVLFGANVMWEVIMEIGGLLR